MVVFYFLIEVDLCCLPQPAAAEYYPHLVPSSTSSLPFSPHSENYSLFISVIQPHEILPVSLLCSCSKKAALGMLAIHFSENFPNCWRALVCDWLI